MLTHQNCPNEDCLGGDDHKAAAKAYTRMSRNWARKGDLRRSQCYAQTVRIIENCPHKEEA